jgi:hypothetical protein
VENCKQSPRYYRDCVEAAISGIAQNASAYGRLLQSKQARSFAVFQRLLEGISRLPGNKTVVLVSQGIDPFVSAYMERAYNSIDDLGDGAGLDRQRIETLRRPLQAGREMEADVAARLRALSELVGKSNTSIYWIGAGKSGATSAMEMGQRSLRSPDGARGELAGRQILEALVEDSGGAAYSGRDLEAAYARLAENLSSYYLLSYRSETAKENVTQAVVRIRKGDREVTLLRTPVAPPTQDLEAGKVHLVDPSAVLNFQSSYHYFVKRKGEYHVRVGVGVSCRFLAPDEKGGKAKDEIVFQFKATDEAGNPAFTGEGKAPVDMPAAQFASMQDRNSVMEYVQRFSLRQGKYALSITVTEKPTGRTHSEVIPLLLPETEPSCPQFTPLVIATGITPSGKQARSPEFTKEGNILYSDQLYEIGISRAFPPTGTLDGFYQLFGAANGQLLLSFKLYRGDTLVNGTTPRPIGATGQDVVTSHFSIPYKNLEAGEYSFEAVVNTADSRCTAATRATFRVVTQN